jgi:hypothetical protein
MKSSDTKSDNCVTEKSCDLLVAIFKENNTTRKVTFQLMGKRLDEAEAEGAYVSVALSFDEHMVGYYV